MHSLPSLVNGGNSILEYLNILESSTSSIGRFSFPFCCSGFNSKPVISFLGFFTYPSVLDKKEIHSTQPSGSKHVKHESNRLNFLRTHLPKIALRIRFSPSLKRLLAFLP